MKKIFVIALAAMSMTFVSCKKGIETQAKAYCEQMIAAEEAGDKEKMAVIEKESEEWIKSLSAEEQQKAKEISEQIYMEYMAKSLGMSVDELKKLQDTPVVEEDDLAEEAPADSTIAEVAEAAAE